MSELNLFYGCFPDIQCLVSMLVPAKPIDISGVLWFFGVLIVVLIAVGLCAALSRQDR